MRRADGLFRHAARSTSSCARRERAGRGRFSAARIATSWADLLRRLSAQNDVRVYQFANVGNHLHLLARCRERRALQTFLRAFAGLIARAVTGAERGRPSGRFWDTLAYSRVITWGREYCSVRAYILDNEFEAGGLPTDRTRRLAAARETRFGRGLKRTRTRVLNDCALLFCAATLDKICALLRRARFAAGMSGTRRDPLVTGAGRRAKRSSFP